VPEKLDQDNVVLNQANGGGRTFHAMFVHHHLLRVTPLRYSAYVRPFDPLRRFVEPAATVTAYSHCKQSLTHEVNQSADTKIDRQQDA
jgi:hypothetical protein